MRLQRRHQVTVHMAVAASFARSRGRALGAVLATACAIVQAFATPPQAHAQTVAPPAVQDAPSPTRGLLIPGGALAGGADATSLSLNPGQLAFTSGIDTALVFNRWKNETAQEGRGVGALMAHAAGPALGFGLGFEWLRPSQVGAPGSYGKSSVGLGLRLGRALSIGGVWEHLFTDRYAGLDSASFGLALRPHDTLALGVVLRDAFRPTVDDVPGGRRLPREWDSEIALRPTGTPRFELAGGMRALRDDGETRLQPHGRLSVGLGRGLALFADAEQARTYRTRSRDFRFGVGLAVSFEQAILAATSVGTLQSDRSGAPVAPGGDQDGLRSPGISVVLRGSTDRQLPLLAPRSVARVHLDGLDNDRSFLSALLGLRRLGDDPSVSAILLMIDDLSTGYGRIEELRQVLLDVGKRKPIIAWVSNAATAEYYLASACQKVAMHPAGALFLSGMAQSVTFWKGAMDRFGVGVDLVRIAEYKGAMEPFVMTEQSAAVRENRLSLLDDLFGRLVGGLGRGRSSAGLDGAAVRTLIDRGLLSAAEAKDRGLIDGMAATDDEIEKFVEASLGRGVRIRDANVRAHDHHRWQPRKVAVIMIDGPINDGRPQGFSPSTAGVAWADPIVDALAAVRRDATVRAVVLRVNSPGGSAFASDRIYREVKRLTEAKKPVIVSMGDTAASGGYYVAAPANTIIASPATVTGSIGIFAYKVDVSGLSSKLGINTEVHTRGARAALYAPYAPWSPEERATITTHLEQAYKQFVGIVADGRKSHGIDPARADQLGRGRVYTGAQALKVGLVDRLGSFADALAEAAHQGHVPTGSGGLPDLVVLPRPSNDPLATLLALRDLVSVGSGGGATDPGFDRGFDEFGISTATGAARSGGASESAAPAVTGSPAALGAAAATLLGPASGALSRLLVPVLLGKGNGIEARLPYELEFR